MSEGEVFLSEIREQPTALRRLLEAADEICDVGARLGKDAPRVVRMVAHGSSDNAASFGVYAFGLLPGWTAMRDSISLSVYYRADVDFAGSVVVALSQSGETADVVSYVKLARARGAVTVAVTNEPDSSLARVADYVAPLRAGPEHAVAATKTYTNQLGALVLLAAAAAGRGQELTRALSSTADLLEEAIQTSERAIRPVAARFGFVGRMYVIGRGVEFATAREVALKLTETCGIAAEPLTATDLAHGPVAALDPLFPVWVIASDDASLPAVVAGAERARQAGATLLASGPAADAIEGAAYHLPVPRPPSPILAPLLSVVPGQLFAWSLARGKGLDPDQPTNLTKVTVVP